MVDALCNLSLFKSVMNVYNASAPTMSSSYHQLHTAVGSPQYRHIHMCLYTWWSPMGWVWCSCVYVSSLSYLTVMCVCICTVLSVEVDWDTCLCLCSVLCWLHTALLFQGPASPADMCPQQPSTADQDTQQGLPLQSDASSLCESMCVCVCAHMCV